MKFDCIETIGGSVQILLVPIRYQSGIDLTSIKHCQPCDSSKTKKIQLINKNGKALLHLGGTGKNPGGILLLCITTMDQALIDRGNLMKMIGPIIRGMILRIHNSSSLSLTGGVNSFSPIQQNSLKNGNDGNDGVCDANNKWERHTAHHAKANTPMHLIGSSSESIHSHPKSYSWRVLFDSTSPSSFSFLPALLRLLPPFNTWWSAKSCKCARRCKW